MRRLDDILVAAHQKNRMNHGPHFAYLSMEIALATELPTYSGGLGVLAGDTLRSAADLGLPVVAVSLVHRNGYFRQEFDAQGRQCTLPAEWRPESHLEALEPRVKVNIADSPVTVRAWLYRVQGEGGHEVPVVLLDTDLPENSAPTRRLTDTLYGGDDRHRLCQEVVLGIGGVRMLRALGHERLDRFHLNEGHAALAVLALIDEEMSGDPDTDSTDALQRVRHRCVFTTHTPVPAGHDRFPRAMAEELLGSEACSRLEALGVGDELNMTAVALEASRFVNGVALRHGEVSRGMFPGYPIRSITNGVHASTWASPPFRRLFDRYLPDWRRDPTCLRGLIAIDPADVESAHRDAKRRLLDTIRNASGRTWDPGRLTLGFARRITAYKRPTLILRDVARLERIAARCGPIQIVFAGKAHPHDDEGQQTIRTLIEQAASLEGDLELVFLPGYDMDLARILVAGVDVWVNTPIPPLEASGTSGMKAALNGVPSLSILDGWWVEGCVEGVTGWAIGRDGSGYDMAPDMRDDLHADELYAKLEHAVLPAYYASPRIMQEIRRAAVALNGSTFNTHRMVLQYLFEAYRDPAEPPLRVHTNNDGESA